jgi:hypothetical protein
MKRKRSFFASKIAILAIFFGTGVMPFSSLAAAQETRSPGSNAAPATPYYHARLTTQVEALAQRYRVRMVLDPDVGSDGGDHDAGEERLSDNRLESGGSATGEKWGMAVCLSQAVRRECLRRKKLAAIVRALDRLPQGELIVESSNGAQSTLLSPSRPHTPGAQAENETLDSKPIYLLTNTALPADGKTPAERLADGQQSPVEIDGAIAARTEAQPDATRYARAAKLPGSRTTSGLARHRRRGIGRLADHGTRHAGEDDTTFHADGARTVRR